MFLTVCSTCFQDRRPWQNLLGCVKHVQVRACNVTCMLDAGEWCAQRAMLRILCTECHVCSAPATAMAPEVQQKIHEVIDFKAQLQKASSGSPVSVKTIQDLYAAKAVHGSKKLVTSSFIEQAVTVHKHLLGNDVCRKILQEFEDKFGTNHSLNNITTLSGLVYRAKRSV